MARGHQGWGVRSEGRRPVTKIGRVAGAAREALPLAVGIGAGWLLGNPLATVVLGHTNHVTSYQHGVLAAMLGYAIASVVVGAVLVNRWLPQRVVIPLGGPMSWMVFLFASFFLGLVAMPFVSLWAAGRLLWAFLAPASVAAAPQPPVDVVYVQYVEAPSATYIEPRIVGRMSSLSTPESRARLRSN